MEFVYLIMPIAYKKSIIKNKPAGWRVRGVKDQASSLLPVSDVLCHIPAFSSGVALPETEGLIDRAKEDGIGYCTAPFDLAHNLHDPVWQATGHAGER